MKNVPNIFFSVIIAIFCGEVMAGRSGGESVERERAGEIPLIILDADIPSSTDDLFALQMLYKYADAGKCRLLGVVVDREGTLGAEIVDIMNTYYGYSNIPIGLVRDGIESPQVWIDYSPLPLHVTSVGERMFRRTLNDYENLPDGWILYRRILAEQPDHSVSICSVGFVTALAQLLQSEPDEYSPLNGVELVRRKVKAIYVMGGVFGKAVEPDYNFGQGVSFAQTYFQLWPKDVDMLFSPGEVGDGVEYPVEQVLADYAWDECHPIRQVYQAYNCNTGQKMWDPMAVIHAVEGDTVFQLSERGNVVITPQAETIFTPSANGNCRYQIPGSDEWNRMMLQKIRYSSKKD